VVNLWPLSHVKRKVEPDLRDGSDADSQAILLLTQRKGGDISRRVAEFAKGTGHAMSVHET
jgi:hypothetical protein